MVEFPIYREEVEKKWDEYDFKDQNFSEVDYNDDQWNKIDLNPNFENHLFFENLYSEDESILQDGTVWFRTNFDVEDPAIKHNLIFQRN